jgi:uncharacterized membrane protein YqjE
LLGIILCLGGPIQLLLWHYARGTERYFGLLSPQELDGELQRRRQWFIRALIIWGIVSAAGLLLAHSLFVLPAVTPAQQNAYGMALILLLGGICTIWNYRLIRHLKRLLRRHVIDRIAQDQEEDDD